MKYLSFHVADVGHKHWDMLGHANRVPMCELNRNATDVTNASKYK